MALASALAWKKLREVVAVGGLPAPIGNDTTLTGFAPSPVPGVNWKFAVNDGDVGVLASMLGEPKSHELACTADLILAVEGEPSLERDNVLYGMIETLTGVLFPSGLGLTVAGFFEDLRLNGDAQRVHEGPVTGEPPREWIELTVSMTLTAPTPLG